MKKNKTVIRSGVRKNKGFAKAKRCQAATLTAQQRWLGLRFGGANPQRGCQRKLFATQISGWPASVASSALAKPNRNADGYTKRPYK
jgi:hypothetical protein